VRAFAARTFAALAFAARAFAARTFAARTLAAGTFSARTVAAPSAIVRHAHVVGRCVVTVAGLVAVADPFLETARLVVVPTFAATARSSIGPLAFARWTAPTRPPPFATALAPFARPPPFATALAPFARPAPFAAALAPFAAALASFAAALASFAETVASVGTATFAATGDRCTAFAAARTTAAGPASRKFLPVPATRWAGVQEVGRLVALFSVVHRFRQRLATLALGASRTAATAAAAPATAALAAELVPVPAARGPRVQEVARLLDVPFDRIVRIGRLVPVVPGAAFSFAHVVSPFRRR